MKSASQNAPFFLYASLSVILLTSGCAFGTRRALLSYQPSFPQAERSRNVTFSVAPFTDQRPNREVIGHVRNGFGMKTATVVARNEVTTWVRDALMAELRRAGYTVVEQPPIEALSVNGQVVHINCESFFSYEGMVTLTVTLKRDRTVLFDRSYTAEESFGLNFAATARSYAKVLEETLREAIHRIVSDINAALAG